MKTNSKYQQLNSDVPGVVSYRSKRSFQIASRLHIAAVDVGNLAALGAADRIRVCGSPSNVWLGTDLHNEDGDCFDGHGTLWRCGEMLCPYCLPVRRRRLRRRVRSAIGGIVPRGGEKWRLLTLTAPTMPGVPVMAVLGIFNRAWSLFRKRKWWVDKVRAGVKGNEFTLGDVKRIEDEGRSWDFSIDGYHVHTHLLALSGWVSWVELGEEWTICLEKALIEGGYDASMNTVHGRAVVDVRLVVDKAKKRRGVVSWEGAVNEVCKYITKAESWLEIPDGQLVEVASVARWSRMLEMLGDCRSVVTSGNPLIDAADPAPVENSFSRNSVDGDSSTAYLDTKALSDGCLPFPEPSRVPQGLIIDVDKRECDRGPTLRMLCVSEPRDVWLKLLNRRVTIVQAYRRGLLTKKYPFAEFKTLKGDRWGSLDNG